MVIKIIFNILGSDGVGKTTHIYNLKKDIEKELELPCRVLSKSDILDKNRYPEAKFIGVDFNTLATECLTLMKGYGRAMWLFYMNSILIAHEPPKENEVVLIDGYWHKHYATEAAFGIDTNWLKNVCLMFPIVDLNILIDIKPEEILNRNKIFTPYECGLDFECKPCSFIKHQTKVQYYLNEIIAEYESIIINGNQSIEEVYSDIKTNIFKIVNQNTKND